MNPILATIRQMLEPCRLPVPVPIPVPVRRTPAARVIMGALGAVTLAAGFLASPSAARHSTARDAVDGRLVDVQVMVEGLPTPLYVRPGAWDKNYFQAFRGKNYSLLVSNTTPERIGVLISVDGLNVVNGQRSSLSNHEAMYVLDPYESATIQGWRSSLRDVRRFVFVDEERSYASRTDQANGDMGWIRVLSFHEKQQRVTWREDRPKVRERSEYGDRRDGSEVERRREGAADSRSNQAPPSAGESSQGGDLRAQKSADRLHSAPQADAVPGTGWGEQRWDPVQRIQFTAMANATDRMVFRYEYASGLRALGIFPRERRIFDRERGEMGFAAPPRW
ncbi:MAG: hypothetical protein ABIS67_02510 [Candidatus Eisenbacteria bacterium]